MVRKKTWREKLDDRKDFPRIEPISEKMSKAWGTGTVVIPVPIEVDGLMKRVPRGKLTTINHIRVFLAKKHGATISCPLCTGIFARIAAEVAMEDEAEGKKRMTPFWRTLKSGGELNPKYPGGVDGQMKRLQSEGHRVIQRGKRYLVENYQKALVRL